MNATNTLEIFTMEQGSPEWHAARCGVITASCFKDILAQGQGKMRRTYLLKLVGERITGNPTESFSNGHMERGKEQEATALRLYSETAGVELAKVGFMKNGNYGASADALIGDAGGAEVKCRLAHLQAELLLSGDVPSEHKAQIQGNMFVSGRKWWDFVSYCPGMPLFIKRVPRDEMYIAGLKRELAAFDHDVNTEMQKIIAKF